MKKIRLFITVAAAAFVTSIFPLAAPTTCADEVTGLLNALVPVQDQSERARQRGLQNGLAQVLVKQTGSTQVLESPGVRQALSLTPHYVTQYGYTTLPAVGADSEETLALTASFSETAINRLLHREQLPIWPSNRMKMLVWLLRDDPEFGKQHITPELMPEAGQALAAALQRRGVPLIKPMLDLQDRLALNPRQAWNFDEEPFAAAAARYNTHLWLAVRFYQAGDGGWRGSAWVSAEGKILFENIAADNVTELINQAVDRIVDGYSRHYTYVPQLQAEALRITLDNVGSYAVFKQVRGYLQNLELVETLVLDAVENDRLRLKLTLNGEPDLLYETLAKNKRFAAIAKQGQVNPDEFQMPDYHFRWVDQP